MRLLLALLCIASNSFAESYHFVSIDKLIEQEIGRVVLPQIYDKLDLSITITPLPGKRAQFEVTSGSRDGEIMRIYSYGEENNTVIRVPTAYYYLETMAFVRKGSGVVINSKEDLLNYKVVKVRGVKHTNNITKGHESVVDLNNTRQIMQFLAAGRANVALTNTVDGLMTIEELGLDEIEPVGVPLERSELYHYIHQKHEELVPKIDHVIKQMIISGELERIIKDAEAAVIDGKTMAKLSNF